MDATKPTILAITGPTASGKTDLVMQVAKHLDGEVISVDSALIYRDMDIGTAKPSLEERSRIVHHLIDICDPTESYSAAEFRTDALRLIDDILKRGKTPILTGGTMLYFKALRDGIADLPSSKPEIRKQIAHRIAQEGIVALHSYLASFDAETAHRLEVTDTQRITRAIEVYLLSGKPLSQWHREQALQVCPFPLRFLALAPSDRAVLHRRIEQRFDNMLERGFVDEVKGLFSRSDIHPDLPSMRSVGYRQFWQYLAGTLSFDEARYKAIVATRQLAKRQFTWLRSWQGVEWINSEENNLERLLSMARSR